MRIGFFVDQADRHETRAQQSDNQTDTHFHKRHTPTYRLPALPPARPPARARTRTRTLTRTHTRTPTQDTIPSHPVQSHHITSLSLASHHILHHITSQYMLHTSSKIWMIPFFSRTSAKGQQRFLYSCRFSPLAPRHWGASGQRPRGQRDVQRHGAAAGGGRMRPPHLPPGEEAGRIRLSQSPSAWVVKKTGATGTRPPPPPLF